MTISLTAFATEEKTKREAEIDQVDATNYYIATKWDQFNRTVDTFFTNQNSPAVNKSSVFFYTSFYKKEGQKIQKEYDFQLKFDLPNTTKKLKIVVERQQDDISNALSDNSVSNTRSVSKDGKVVSSRKDTRYTAGANFLLRQKNYFVSSLHFGIRLDMPLNPNIRLDMQKDIKTSFMNINLSQKFIIYRQEGFQEISQALFSKQWSKTIQTGFVNSLVWTDETDAFLLRNNIVLSQDLGDEKSLSYSVGANASLKPRFQYDSYDVSVTYRQLVYKSWLYGNFTVGADFPKAVGFNDEKFVQVRFDIFFKEKYKD